jgi:hypothetical protein
VVTTSLYPLEQRHSKTRITSIELFIKILFAIDINHLLYLYFIVSAYNSGLTVTVLNYYLLFNLITKLQCSGKKHKNSSQTPTIQKIIVLIETNKQKV